MKFISESEEQTELFAKKTAEKYKGSPTFLLFGDLGAGKTAFTRGLTKGYGSDARVSSPTFTIVHEYPGKTTVYHFDLYRINDSDELYDIGFFDYFKEGTVRVIEWPDAFLDEMPADAVRVKISRTELDGQRMIEIED